MGRSSFFQHIFIDEVYDDIGKIEFFTGGTPYEFGSSYLASEVGFLQI